MRTSRFGQFLLVVGGCVGVAAVVGLVVGFEPAQLPDALLNIAVYKLTFAAAAGLLAAGAIVHRYARGAEVRSNLSAQPPGVSGGTRSALGDGAGASDFAPRPKSQSRVEVPKSQ